MRKYTSPEIQINKVNKEDIITTSMSLPIVPLIYVCEDEADKA